jgi:CubicO group peptidase (beta-lactamase class C family)
MPRRRSSLARILGMSALAVAVLLAVAVGALLWLDIPRNAAGMAAKGVCSAHFIAGRPWQGLLAEDVVPASAALAPITLDVDAPAQRVTARFAGFFAREARLLPHRGCVLDVDAPLNPKPPAEDAPAPSTARWPEGEAAVPPQEWGAGVDAAALQMVLAQAFAGAGDPQATNARGVAIVHRGRLLVARTAPGFGPQTALHGWSMTKTVAAMLAYKRAMETGLALHTPVVQVFEATHAPGWVARWQADARRTITVADLFFMRDGLANTEDYSPTGAVPRMLWGESNAPAYAAQAAAQAPAGERWRYLSQTANLLAAVARSRFRNDAQYWGYPRAALFDPIGARTAVLETDTAGNWVGSSYLWASLGDWARLGQLMLQDGRWAENQVLPPGWLQMAGTRATPTGEGRGYGAQTWRIGDPDAGDCRAQGLPPDTLAMRGHWGQIVAMVPSRDLVVVRLGWTFDRTQFDGCAFVAQALRAFPR